MKRTPLYDMHLKYGGKMTDFQGWALPVSYGSGIISEHNAVRKHAGLFDVSHMGELMIEGKNAGEFLDGMVTNSIARMKDGSATYTPVCRPDGGTVDDVLVYRLDSERYMVVVNASNTHKDYEWFKNNAKGRTTVTDVSCDYVQLAVQGPAYGHILQQITRQNLSEIKFFRFCDRADMGGTSVLISRTGYTGEDGFEIYADPDDAETLWEIILDKGKEELMVPAGLGARDTLRLEAALPLYGSELSEGITPVEAGLDRFIDFNKSFIGRDALLAGKKDSCARRIAGFEMMERGLPRSGYKVTWEGREAEFVTSGGYSPTLNRNIGMALIDSEHAVAGKKIEIAIRGIGRRAVIVKLPFYKRKKKQEA